MGVINLHISLHTAKIYYKFQADKNLPVYGIFCLAKLHRIACPSMSTFSVCYWFHWIDSIDGHVCWNSNHRPLPFIACRPKKTNFCFLFTLAANKRKFAISVFLYPKLLFFSWSRSVSGSGFNLDFRSGFGSRLYMKNTFELQILTLQKSKFVNFFYMFTTSHLTADHLKHCKKGNFFFNLYILTALHFLVGNRT